jgi:putative oxidoreductase
MFTNLALLLSRCLAAPIMLVYGWDKLININEFVENPATKRFMEVIANGVTAPLWFAYANAIFQFGISIAILIGFKTRISAGLVVLWLIPVTYFGHPFWTGVNQADYEVNFYKNLGIISAYLMISCVGGGKYSWDAARFGK